MCMVESVTGGLWASVSTRCCLERLHFMLSHSLRLMGRSCNTRYMYKNYKYLKILFCKPRVRCSRRVWLGWSLESHQSFQLTLPHSCIKEKSVYTAYCTRKSTVHVHAHVHVQYMYVCGYIDHIGVCHYVP